MNALNKWTPAGLDKVVFHCVRVCCSSPSPTYPYYRPSVAPPRNFRLVIQTGMSSLPGHLLSPCLFVLGYLVLVLSFYSEIYRADAFELE